MFAVIKDRRPHGGLVVSDDTSQPGFDSLVGAFYEDFALSPHPC